MDEWYSAPCGRATTSRWASSRTSGAETLRGRITVDGLPFSQNRRTVSSLGSSTWLMTNSMQRWISSGRSRVLGMIIKSRVSSISRRRRDSSLRLVSVITPFDRQLGPGFRQYHAALFVVFSQAEKLTFDDFALVINVKIKRNDSFVLARPVEHLCVINEGEKLIAVE